MWPPALQQTLATWRHEPGGLLPLLHAVQDELGFIPPELVPQIAAAFNLSRAEVHGVISYYHHFRSKPAVGRVIQICRAEACQSMGADQLVAHAELRLGCSLHGASSDGRFTLEPTFCLGLCASSPAMMIGEDLHARVTPQAFDALISGSAA